MTAIRGTKTGIDGLDTRKFIYWSLFLRLEDSVVVQSSKPPKNPSQHSPRNAGRLASSIAQRILPNIISIHPTITRGAIFVKTTSGEYAIILKKSLGATGIEKIVSHGDFSEFVSGYNEVAKLLGNMISINIDEVNNMNLKEIACKIVILSESQTRLNETVVSTARKIISLGGDDSENEIIPEDEELPVSDEEFLEFFSSFQI